MFNSVINEVKQKPCQRSRQPEILCLHMKNQWEMSESVEIIANKITWEPPGYWDFGGEGRGFDLELGQVQNRQAFLQRTWGPWGAEFHGLMLVKQTGATKDR